MKKIKIYTFTSAANSSHTSKNCKPTLVSRIISVKSINFKKNINGQKRMLKIYPLTHKRTKKSTKDFYQQIIVEFYSSTALY